MPPKKQSDWRKESHHHKHEKPVRQKDSSSGKFDLRQEQEETQLALALSLSESDNKSNLGDHAQEVVRPKSYSQVKRPASSLGGGEDKQKQGYGTRAHHKHRDKEKYHRPSPTFSNTSGDKSARSKKTREVCGHETGHKEKRIRFYKSSDEYYCFTNFYYEGAGFNLWGIFGKTENNVSNAVNIMKVLLNVIM
ncbi:hypothetical protein CI610_00051 [invertebrate metagenome]|uniref:Uncharacterized protein n=1 Tax=invertebrate metagenome TaxID=1711999 RepID=A0A2H9TCR3_9ZZZZ